MMMINTIMHKDTVMVTKILLCVSKSCQKCLEPTAESSGREFQTIGQVTEKVSYFNSNVGNHGCGCYGCCCSWIQMMYRWRMQ